MSRQSKSEPNQNSFTRSQLHEYFRDRYTPEQVNRALELLAQDGAEVDAHGDSFSFDITEELEEIFKAIGSALGAQKSLSQPTDVLAVAGEAAKIAAQFSTHANPQLMASMIKIVAEQSIAEAVALTQIRSQVIEEVLKQGDLAIAQSLLNRGNETANYIQGLAGDRARINKMTANYGVSFDIDGFLTEAKQLTATVKKSVGAIAPANHQTFDVDAFLLEAGEI